MKATAIYCAGPEADIDRDGEEIPVWYVWAGDDDGEEIEPAYRFEIYENAVQFGRMFAQRRRLPFECEAMRA